MIEKNLVLNRSEKKPIVWDAFFNSNKKPKPLVIFCHGYKGFKDWGSWDLVAETFLEENVFFMKFNFSHNGGTVEHPIDFPDLEAFAENNYTKELEDLEDLINFLLSKGNPFNHEIDPTNITLLGHSRGGGISILKASEDQRITKLITWASVCAFGKRTATTGNLEQWKKEGVKYVLNSRTKQQMPHNYQFHENYMTNKKRLNIENATKNIAIPQLIIHGKEDPSVKFSEAESIYSWNLDSELYPVYNSNHVFNSKHPWEDNDLPLALKQVVEKSIAFIKETN
ncbi:alpha/beta hydrolase [Flavobacteriales bacterium 34_180_T64]|nr:alpha/beta hydrolase [Flavobacteriales bacterium 34_180_T64]